MESTDNTSGTESLDELLDCCLEDFGKPLPKTVAAGSEKKSSTDVPQGMKQGTNSTSKLDNAAWGEEFQQFNEVMEHFLEDEEELNELRNIMGNLGPTENNPDMEQHLAETIRGLMEGAQNIPEPSAEELANLFEGMGLGNGADGNVPELMPLMQNMMQKLMSKELLYPSLKEIVEKYPKWLADHESSLGEQELQKYREQFRLMEEVCRVFETQVQSGGESEEAKKRSFETVLQLMQKIQSCGNPPRELVSDSSRPLPLDEEGNLHIPGMPDQCAIM